jgi:SAM-dependent methyltransferase
MDSMSDTYSAVDHSHDVRAAIEWQDRIDAWPAIDAYKRRSYELIGSARPVLDVGCGTGHDATRLGAEAVGVDASIAMCRTARERGVRVGRADAYALPFAAESFAGARADRVLQHLEDPLRALAELVRVTAPGGRVVVCDPDQGSLVIALPGARTALVQRITELRADTGYRNGHYARRLPRCCADLGLVDVTVDAFPLVLTDPDDAFGLPGWPEYWRAEGPFTDEDVAEWTTAVHAARNAPGFVFALSYLVVSGRRP